MSSQIRYLHYPIARYVIQMSSEKQRFERDYRQWISLVASDIATSVKNLEIPKIKGVLERCEEYQKDSPSMYVEISGDVRARMEGLVGSGRLDDIILLSTDAVAFSPSIFMQHPGMLDYTIAMNRRFFFRIYWFSLITINRLYIERATDRMLHFILEHELVQNEMYTEHVHHYGHQFLSTEEKRAISQQAMEKSIERSGITEEERESEQELMHEIAACSPLVPKTFAETALFEYLEKHWDRIKHLGVKGKTESEKEFESMISQEYGWIDFSHETYGLFLRALKQELDVTYLEYGYV